MISKVQNIHSDAYVRLCIVVVYPEWAIVIKRSQMLLPGSTRMGTRRWTSWNRRKWNKSWRRKGCGLFFEFEFCLARLCFLMDVYCENTTNLVLYVVLGRTQYRASKSWKRYVSRWPRRDYRFSKVCAFIKTTQNYERNYYV